MIERAETGERVYLAIKIHLAQSDDRPGERIDIADLSRRVAASATPVRAALHRLAGERLLTSHQGEGFSLPRVTEPGLTDLYAWNASLLSQAARVFPVNRPPAPSRASFEAPTDLVPGVERLFAYVAAFSDNVEVEWAQAGAGDRLHRVRRVEIDLLADPRAELLELADLALGEDQAALRQGLIAYHRRRLRIVPAIVRSLHGLGDREPR